jgi:HEAT repeat protein
VKRRRWIIGAAVLLLAGVALALWADSDRRLLGRACGEPFFQGRAASAWHRDLRSTDEAKSAEAINTLIAGKGEAVPVCAWVLRSAPDPEGRWHAADALAKIGKEAAPAGAELIAALNDADPIVRGVAIRAVGEVMPAAAEAVPALVKLFPDVDAIRAVSRYKRDGAVAVPRLIAMLKHDDSAVRWQAARTLGKIGEPALASLPELMRLTTGDPQPQVREHAAEAMGDIGPAAAAGIPALVAAMHDPNARVRRDAVRALGDMGPAAKAALGEVKAAIQDPDDAVKTAAERAARLIDPSIAK